MSRIHHKEFSQYALKIPIQLSDLTNWEFCVNKSTLLKKIVKELEARPELPGVMIIDENRLMGMISRNDCFQKLSRPFSLDLFLQKPVGDLLPHFSTPYDIYEANTLIQDAVSQALSRPKEQLYEPVIVRIGSGTFRMIDFHDLLLGQTVLLQESNQKILQQFNVARSLSTTLDMQSFSDYIFEIVEEILPHTRIILLLKKNGYHFAHSWFGFSHEINQNQIEICLRDYFPFMDRVERNNPLLFPDQQFLQKLNQLLNENNFWQLFPIIHADEMIGGILFGRPDPSGIGDAVFEQYELVSLSSYCPMLATALRNSQLYQEVQQSSMTDPLTNVLNRRGLFEQYSPEENEFFSLLMIDIDYFKQINDTHGHLFADEILKQLIRIINRIIRPGDRIGRYGGDEFIILLKQTDLAKAVQIAERIRQTIWAYEFRFDEQTISITISIGVAQSEDHETLDGLLQRADHQLYLSKENGRNQVSPATNQ